MTHSNNPASAASTIVEMQVEYRVPFSVNGTDYPDCVRVIHTANGQFVSKWTYCFQVGPVLIEQPTAQGMLEGELIGLINARIGFSSAYGNPNPCDLTFVPLGFDPGEAVDVRIVHPDGRTVTRDSVRIGAQGNNIKVKATAQDPAGAWVLYANGTQHQAMVVLQWQGNCS